MDDAAKVHSFEDELGMVMMGRERAPAERGPDATEMQRAQHTALARVYGAGSRVRRKDRQGVRESVAGHADAPGGYKNVVKIRRIS